MAGYAPLFDTIATGTLYGRWPDIGIWPIVLALADKHGHLDVTPHYLAGVLGLPVDQVDACMKRFCEPDPYSRSKADNGARLRLIDANRDWGWIVVNHFKYREKARLMAKDSARTDSGLDASRKRKQRKSPVVPRCPPDSPSQSQSQSQTHTQTKTEEVRSAARSPTRIPENFELTEDLKAVAEKEGLDASRTFATFVDFWRAKAGPDAKKMDWPATWRGWCRRQADFKTQANAPRKTRFEEITEGLRGE